jgi:hypothetical protein
MSKKKLSRESEERQIKPGGIFMTMSERDFGVGPVWVTRRRNGDLIHREVVYNCLKYSRMLVKLLKKSIHGAPV